jgi:hypothetical protein
MALSRINSQSIADGTVIASDIADGSITTAKIADGNVTSAKIDTVANTKIAGVITTSQLANNLTVNASSIISSANIDFKVGASQNTAAKIDSNENLQFNSGYGSVATAYGCRAWCVFTGTGTVSLTGNGNVSSITDLNTGSYQVNFATALSDANYAGLATCGGANANDSRTLNGTVQARTTANCVITTVAYNVGNDGFDCDRVYFAAFR